MKKNRNYSSFETSTRRRRSSLPVIPVVLLILVAAFTWFIWARGGEKPMMTVEKPVAAERLGK